MEDLIKANKFFLNKDYYEGLKILEDLNNNNFDIFQRINNKKSFLVKTLTPNKEFLLYKYNISVNSLKFKKNQEFIKRMKYNDLIKYLYLIKCNKTFNNIIILNNLALCDNNIINKININAKINNYFLINHLNILEKIIHLYSIDDIYNQLEITNYKFASNMKYRFNISYFSYLVNCQHNENKVKLLVKIFKKIVPYLFCLDKSIIDLIISNINLFDEIIINYVNTKNKFIINHNCLKNNFLENLLIFNYYLNYSKPNISFYMNILNYLIKYNLYTLQIKFLELFNDKILDFNVNGIIIKNYFKNININFTNQIIL